MNEITEDSYLCVFCKSKNNENINVEKIRAYEPWNDEHWCCPLCCSTYNIREYPK